MNYRDYPTFYSATSPCPICGRYKSAYKNKCFGFITSNEAYAYCSREENPGKTIEIFGHTCWRHPLVGFEYRGTVSHSH